MFLRLDFNISGILYANSKSSQPQVEKSTIPIKNTLNNKYNQRVTDL